MLSEAMAIAQSIGDAHVRARLTINIARVLTGRKKTRAISEALATIYQITDMRYQTNYLFALAELCRGELRNKFAHESWQSSIKLPSCYKTIRIRTQATLLPYLNECDRELVVKQLLEWTNDPARSPSQPRLLAYVLVRIAKYLTTNEKKSALTEALNVFNRFELSYDIVDTFIDVASFIPDRIRTEMATKALAALKRNNGRREYYQKLASLSPFISQDELYIAFQEERSIGREDLEIIRSFVLLAIQTQNIDYHSMLLKTALDIICKFQHDGTKVHSYVIILQSLLLSEEEQEEVIAKALDAAYGMIDEPSNRVYALNAIVPFINEQMRNDVINDAHQLALSIDTGVSLFYEKEKVHALVSVIPNVPEKYNELFHEALQIAYSIGNIEEKTYALIAVAKRASGDEKRRILDDALSYTKYFDGMNRINALAFLVTRMVGNPQQVKRILIQMLRLARDTIQTKENAVYFLKMITREKDGFSKDTIHQLLELSTDSRVSLNRNEYGQFLHTALTLMSKEPSEMTATELYSHWSIMLDILSQLRRVDLLDNLCCYAQLIKLLGEDHAIIDSGKAIKEMINRWP